MRVITSTVVGGKVEVPEATLEEGSRVAILAPDGDEPIELTTEEQRELSAAMEEIRRGAFATAPTRSQTLEVERLWWSNRQRFQRPDGNGGTETDEEAMKTFIAKELQVDPADVNLARLWLEPYDPET